MTVSPPWTARQRLRVRAYRRAARRRVARLLAGLAARLDPPTPVLDRARAAHPSNLPPPPRLAAVNGQHVEWSEQHRTRVLRPRESP